MTKDMTGILVMGVENSNVRIYSKITFRICSKIMLEFIPKIYLWYWDESKGWGTFEYPSLHKIPVI